MGAKSKQSVGCFALGMSQRFSFAAIAALGCGGKDTCPTGYVCTPVAAAGEDGSASAQDASVQDAGPAGSDATVGRDGSTGPANDARTTGATDALVPGLSGIYKGYIQSFMFPDGSDTVVMTLAFATDGTITGTVLLGDAPLLPPTNPNVGYPPGFGSGGTLAGVPLEGFNFTILQGTYTAPRVQLQIQSNEVWKQWCQIQTMIYPKYNSAPNGACGGLLGYGCLPNVAFSSGSTCSWSSCQEPANVSVDCGKLALCGAGSVCTCTATSCTVPLGPQGDISFDMVLSSGSLNGSERGIDEPGQQQNALNVILMKE